MNANDDLILYVKLKYGSEFTVDNVRTFPKEVQLLILDRLYVINEPYIRFNDVVLEELYNYENRQNKQ